MAKKTFMVELDSKASQISAEEVPQQPQCLHCLVWSGQPLQLDCPLIKMLSIHRCPAVLQHSAHSCQKRCCTARRDLPHTHLWVFTVTVQRAVPLLAGQNTVIGTRRAPKAIVLSERCLHIPRNPGHKRQETSTATLQRCNHENSVTSGGPQSAYNCQLQCSMVTGGKSCPGSQCE